MPPSFWQFGSSNSSEKEMLTIIELAEEALVFKFRKMFQQQWNGQQGVFNQKSGNTNTNCIRGFNHTSVTFQGICK